MRHVLARPASTALAATAQELLAASEQEAVAPAVQVGDPDAITDEHGDLSPARWERHLDEHITSSATCVRGRKSAPEPRCQQADTGHVSPVTDTRAAVRHA